MRPANQSKDQAREIDARDNAEAMLNILADFSEDKTHLQNMQRAILNILDDANAEKNRLGETQRAVMNILDDANIETDNLRTTQRAMINIMEDFDSEKNAHNKSEEQIRALNQDLEGFAYSVSHDLRTPLRAIDGFSLQVLKRYADKLDDEGQRYLNMVRDNTKKMSQLIDDILAFSRMGRLNLAAEKIDMEALAQDALDALKPDHAGRALAFEIEPLPPCRGDPAMLRQVWVNLLGNAIKFTRHTQAARIKVSAHTEGTEQIYAIQDNGAGFDMRYADKLFGVFQRLHGNEEFEGTGIGLAIVKRIVTRHGGRVWAEGKVDAGAAFYFALPI